MAQMMRRTTAAIISALLSSSLLFQGLLIAVDLLVETDALRPSRGCDRNRFPRGFRPGKTTKVRKQVNGNPRRTHSITLPFTYNMDPSIVANDPPPLLLFFHGYGGNHRSCGERCKVDAPNNGFVSLRMTGYGVFIVLCS